MKPEIRKFLNPLQRLERKIARRARHFGTSERERQEAEEILDMAHSGENGFSDQEIRKASEISLH